MEENEKGLQRGNMVGRVAEESEWMRERYVNMVHFNVYTYFRYFLSYL